MKVPLCAAVAFLAAGAALAGEVHVLPVVADAVPGLQGSRWETQVRVLKVQVMDSVVIRRKWVCLDGGGFADDPGTAPTWEMPWSYDDFCARRLLVLGAGDLLQGSGARVGAVALEVEGGEVIVSVSVTDISLGGHIGGNPGMPFGIGQTYTTRQGALQGPSHISWIGGCYGESSLIEACDFHYRNNIGLVNPNPEQVTVRLDVLPFAPSTLSGRQGGKEYVLPPYGWQQAPFPLDDRFLAFCIPVFHVQYPQFAVVNVRPDGDLPYHAYASVVYTPPPGVSATTFSDPYFQHAEPGYISSYGDIPEPPASR